MSRLVMISIVMGSLLIAGCGVMPLGGSPPPTIIETTDYVPLADGLKFVGICSVACSLIWGVSLITHANIKRKETHEFGSQTNPGGPELLHSGNRRRSRRSRRSKRK